MTIRKRICKAIAESGESLIEMAKNVDLEYPTLTAFVASVGDRARLSTAEKLAEYLGLELVDKRED